MGDISKVKHLDEYVEVYRVIKHRHLIIPKAVYKRMDDLWDITKIDDNLLEVPSGFHGNHPAYSEWVTKVLNDSRLNGKLTPEAVSKVVDNAQIEINKAFKHWKETGENMNTYFKKLLQQ